MQKTVQKQCNLMQKTVQLQGAILSPIYIGGIIALQITGKGKVNF